MIIDLTTTSDALATALTDVGHWRISPTLSPLELQVLCRRHANESYVAELLSAVTTHPAADDGVLRAILCLVPNDVTIQNSVASSGKASIPLLRALAASPAQSVRDHASLALIEKETIPAADESVLRSLLDRHGGDEGISLGVRHLLAKHEQTPDSILRRLVNDEVDFIASTARENLQRRRSQSAQNSSKTKSRQ